MKESLENEEKLKETLRFKAQVNEYLFSLMQENRVTAQLDEDIGIDFINLRRTSKACRVRVPASILERNDSLDFSNPNDQSAEATRLFSSCNSEADRSIEMQNELLRYRE